MSMDLPCACPSTVAASCFYYILIPLEHHCSIAYIVPLFHVKSLKYHVLAYLFSFFVVSTIEARIDHSLREGSRDSRSAQTSFSTVSIQELVNVPNLIGFTSPKQISSNISWVICQPQSLGDV